MLFLAGCKTLNQETLVRRDRDLVFFGKQFLPRVFAQLDRRRQVQAGRLLRLLLTLLRLEFRGHDTSLRPLGNGEGFRRQPVPATVNPERSRIDSRSRGFLLFCPCRRKNKQKDPRSRHPDCAATQGFSTSPTLVQNKPVTKVASKIQSNTPRFSFKVSMISSAIEPISRPDVCTQNAAFRYSGRLSS